MEIKSTNKKATVLVNRIKRHKKEFLRFVKHKEVEYYNNRAERAIRAVVIFRKLSFGSRTPEGAQYYAILSSVLETCRLKGKSILAFLKDVLKTQDEKLHEITESLLKPPLILNKPGLTVTIYVTPELLDTFPLSVVCGALAVTLSTSSS